jgi:hypothetical protein
MDYTLMRQKIGESMRRLVSGYFQNPFTWLYEADLQAELSQFLSGVLPETIATRPSGKHAGWFRDPTEIRTPIVHREYPDTKRFDGSGTCSVH